MEDMAMKTFKEGLHPESELRHSFSKRSAKSMRDLMSRIEQYVRVEEDKARTGASSTQNRPPRRPNNTKQKRAEIPPRNPTRFPRPKEAGGVYTVFNQPIYRIMGDIKNEPFFIWRRTLIWIFGRKHSANGPDHIECPYRTNQFGNRICGSRRTVPLHGNYGTKMAAQVESRAFLFPSKTPFPNRLRYNGD